MNNNNAGTSQGQGMRNVASVTLLPMPMSFSKNSPKSTTSPKATPKTQFKTSQMTSPKAKSKGTPKATPKASPKTPPSAKTTSNKGRPSTPHPKAKGNAFAFDSTSASNSVESLTPPNSSSMTFDFASVEESEQADTTPEGCIGISLAAVMNTFRGPSSINTGLPSSPSFINEEDGTILRKLSRFRSTIQNTFNCAERRTCRPSSCQSIDDRLTWDDQHLSFEEVEHAKSLMQRAASWGTQETENDSRSDERKSNVQFHYPPITSVRVRPRTGSDEIKQLFFAPEELDEIEDDRSDTRAADDIETLAVGSENWNTVRSSSSIITASDYDDQDTRHGLLLAGGASNLMFDPMASPRKRDKRYVRGVQIMLREKSTG